MHDTGLCAVRSTGLRECCLTSYSHFVHLLIRICAFTVDRRIAIPTAWSKGKLARKSAVKHQFSCSDPKRSQTNGSSSAVNLSGFRVRRHADGRTAEAPAPMMSAPDHPVLARFPDQKVQQMKG